MSLDGIWEVGDGSRKQYGKFYSGVSDKGRSQGEFEELKIEASSDIRRMTEGD